MVMLIDKGKHFISIEKFQFTCKLLEDKKQSKFGIMMTLCVCVIFTSIFYKIGEISSKSGAKVMKKWVKEPTEEVFGDLEKIWIKSKEKGRKIP